MIRSLVTGGAGFIGLHLAHELLERGHHVDLVDDFSRGVLDGDLKKVAEHPGTRLIEANLLKAEGLRELGEDYRYIFHLAAIIGVRNVLDRPYAVLRDNVELTTNLLSVVERQRSMDRFVFASTSEVYAGTLQHFTLPVPTPESTPLAIPDLAHPRTSYMLSKMYGEALCHQSGARFTIVRPHNFYGPRMGMSHVIPELLSRVHSLEPGERLQVYSVDHRRTFCYIQDAVRMIAAAAESPDGVGETFNVGNQTPEVTIEQLAKSVLSVVGRQAEIEALPATSGSPPRRCPDVSRIVGTTGYDTRISLEDGIRMTYDWYRERIFEGDEIGAR